MASAADCLEVELAATPAGHPVGAYPEQRGVCSRTARALELARRGDRGAAGFLYARYGDDVYECARAIVLDRDSAIEATRKVFASLAEPTGWPAPRLISPRGWLLARTRQLALHEVAPADYPA